MNNSSIALPSTPTRPRRNEEWIPKTPASKSAARKRLDGVMTMPNLSTLLSTPQRSTQMTKKRHAQSSPAFGDRYIPNRSNMDMDRCSASIQAGEKRRIDVLPKAATARRQKLAGNDIRGQDNDDIPTAPVSQRQVEFNRQMEAVLFNIPPERLERNENTVPSSTDGARSERSTTLSFSTPQDPTSLVYSSIPELLDEAKECEDPLRVRSTEPLLSFGSSNGGASGSSTVGMRNRRRVPSPFDHDILHVLQQSGMPSSGGGSSNGNGDSIRRGLKAYPLQVLETPRLVDDYYLNLISWSENNILAVALGDSVWLYDYCTKNVSKLLELPGAEDFTPSTAYISSVSWSTANAAFLAVGISNSAIQLWDTVAMQPIRVLYGHGGRVCSMAWNGQMFSSGSQDSMIHQHDIRADNHITAKLKGHTLQVCGLKWNIDGTVLASGGNENYVCIWDAAMSSGQNSQTDNNSYTLPRYTLTQHTAAVKALAWSPFRRHKLASGGGSADRSIMTWNTANGAQLSSIDTGSQVCSLIWSKHSNEIVSAHGFSRNQLTLWKYPSMTRIQEFNQHAGRVLNLEMSPDFRIIASISSDQTLCFWEMFEARTSQSPFGICDLQLGNSVIR